MIFVFGRRVLGRVAEVDGSYVVTEFAHLNFVPLIPIRSHLVFEEDGVERSVPIRLHLGSVVSAYARTVAVVAAFASFVAGVAAIWSGDRRATLDRFLLTLAFFALGFIFFVLVGRPSSRDVARRRTYAAFIGAPADPAWLLEGVETLKGRLSQTLAERGRVTDALATYRSSADMDVAWERVALSPQTGDPDFLRAAMTRARLEWGEARGARRNELARLHDALFERVARLGDSNGGPSGRASGGTGEKLSSGGEPG